MKRIVALCALLVAAAPHAAGAAELVETPMFKDTVAAGKLPPVAKRVPSQPLVVAYDRKTAAPGQHGGTLNMLIGRSRDVRMLVVYVLCDGRDKTPLTQHPWKKSTRPSGATTSVPTTRKGSSPAGRSRCTAGPRAKPTSKGWPRPDRADAPRRSALRACRQASRDCFRR